MPGSNFVLLILPNRKGRMKVWVIHKLENWCLMRAAGIFLEVINAMPTASAYFRFETSHPETTIATTLVAEGRCVSFTKTASFPSFLSSPGATKGPATWRLQRHREADRSHTRNSSAVLPAGITGLRPPGRFASFQPGEPEAPLLTANLLRRPGGSVELS